MRPAAYRSTRIAKQPTRPCGARLHTGTWVVVVVAAGAGGVDNATSTAGTRTSRTSRRSMKRLRGGGGDASIRAVIVVRDHVRGRCGSPAQTSTAVEYRRKR